MERRLQEEQEARESRMESQRQTRELSTLTREFHYYLRTEKVLRARGQRLAERAQNESSLNSTIQVERSRKSERCERLRREREDRQSIYAMAIEQRIDRVDSDRHLYATLMLDRARLNERRLQDLRKQYQELNFSDHR
jgi:hypothetical protein